MHDHDLNRWKASGRERRLGCLMLMLPESTAHRLEQFTAAIPDSLIVPPGRELEPHITVLWGLTTNNPAKVQRVIGGFGPVTVRLGRTQFFPATETRDSDVLHLSVHSEALRRLHELVGDKLQHESTFNIFRPHVTLAYIRPAAGFELAGKEPFTQDQLTFNTVRYAAPDGRRYDLKLADDGKRRSEYRRTPRRGKSADGGDYRNRVAELLAELSQETPPDA